MKEGDFAKIEYTGKTAGRVFDTTDAEKAKKANIFNPRAKYGAVLVPVGKGVAVKGFDEALLAANKGDSKTVKLTADKAFGQRNGQLVKLLPMNSFKQQNIEPKPGMVLDFDGQSGRVQSVSGGRVMVDFNHELAGQEIEYEFKVVEVFDKPEDKVPALAQDLVPGVKASFAAGTVTAIAGEDTKKDTEFIVSKMRFVSQLFAYVPEVKRVAFTEEYAKEGKDASQ
ncbi:Putative FKBP-type peptidyl-prolyl cis-trans isomerase [Candidatus Norongarragalina meridionalis]|nr:Putative FKBP-type peptidyl-prolyl cis-trans isomerase [Candidatus Norongarragalina meridionalis]